MKRLISEALDLIQSKNMSIRNIAAKTGIGRSAIHNGLIGRTDMKFDTFFLMSPMIYDNQKERREKINEFIMCCEGTLNIRKALCYCQVTGEFDLMRKLIKKHRNNRELKKYLNIYKLYNKRNLNELRGKQLLDAIYDKDISHDAECQVLLDGLSMAAMYDKQNYGAMIPYGNKMLRDLENVQNAFIKRCLQTLCDERFAYAYLFRNEIALCREICEKIIASDLDFISVKATALCCLGESYILGCDENIFLAEKYIKDGIKMLESMDSSQATRKLITFNSTLALLYIENSFNIDKINFDYIEDSELAYYECKFGDKKKGEDIFENLKKKQNGLSSFQQYYTSKLNNDIIGLEQSLLSFERSGNLFYASLAKKSLNKRRNEDV